MDVKGSLVRKAFCEKEPPVKNSGYLKIKKD